MTAGARTFVRATATTLLVATLAACAHAPPREGDASFRVRLIGEQVVAHRLAFGGTIVGGLSGIDYDADAKIYYLVSDDRSARVYTARLRFDATRFDEATLLDVIPLRRPDGQAFVSEGSDEIADGEAIRFDARTRWLWWASEGERRIRVQGNRLVDPFVRATTREGQHVASVPLDPMFRMRATANGPRDNRVFEGLSFSTSGDALWVAMEGPLLQDGPMPSARAGAWSRISVHPRVADGSFGAMSTQWAYPLDPLPGAPFGFSAYAVNGLSEILALDDERMLVLERSFVIGLGWGARLFEADPRGATDVREIVSLAGDDRFIPMTKRLVLDFAALEVVVDNLEGMCFGPTLENGHRTLVFVSDDNFNPAEKTQFLAFELVPR